MQGSRRRGCMNFNLWAYMYQQHVGVEGVQHVPPFRTCHRSSPQEIIRSCAAFGHPQKRIKNVEQCVTCHSWGTCRLYPTHSRHFCLLSFRIACDCLRLPPPPSRVSPAYPLHPFWLHLRSIKKGINSPSLLFPPYKQYIISSERGT